MADSLKILIQATLAATTETDINTEIGKLKINTLQIPISVSTQEIKKILDELNVEIGNSNKKQPRIRVFDTDKLHDEGKKYFTDVKNIVSQVHAHFKELGAVDVNVDKILDSGKGIQSFTANVKQADGVVQSFNFKLGQLATAGENIGVGFAQINKISSNKILGTDWEKKLNILNNLDNRLKNITQTAFESSKAITNSDHVNDLQEAYLDIHNALEEVRNSSAALSEEQKRNINTMIADAERLRKKYVELGKPTKPTDNKPSINILNTKDLDAQKIKYFKGIDDIENRIKEFYAFEGTTNVTFFKNAQQEITGFTASVTKSDGVVEKFKYKLATLDTTSGKGFVYDGGGVVDKLIGTNLDAKLDKLNQLKNTLKSLQDRAFNLTKPVQQEANVTDLKNKYAAIETEIKRIEASGNAMSKSEIRNLNNLVKEADRARKKYQELERPAKDMEAKPLSYTKSEYIAELSAMEKKLAHSGVLVGELKSKFGDLKTAAGSINDKKSLEKFKNDFILFKKEASGATTTLRRFNAETAQNIAKNKLSIFLQQNPKALKANSQGFKELGESIKGITNTTNRTNWNQKFTEVTGTVEKLGKKGKTVFGSLIKNAQKFVGWLVASGGVMAAISTFKNMISVVISLDKALVNLQMATGFSRKETVLLLETYNKLGQKIGATTQEVSDSANSFLRQGMSIADANTMIENSLILSKLGMISSAESTQYMTSAMKGYGVAVKDTLGIVDMLSAVDLVSATDAGGLAEAMSRTAASAKIAGIEMSQLIGYIATISEVSQKDATSVGESLKTIFARMRDIKLGKSTDEEGESLSNVESVLSDLDIKLRDSAGEFRNFGKVIDDVGKNWDSYGSVQQAAIAKAFSGVRQQENWLILMSNYGKALEYNEVAMNSAGTANEKMEAYNNSLEASLKRLTASFEALSTTFINSDLVKNTIDWGTGFLKILNGIVSTFGTLGTAASVALGVISAKGSGRIKMLILKKYATGISNGNINELRIA